MHVIQKPESADIINNFILHTEYISQNNSHKIKLCPTANNDQTTNNTRRGEKTVLKACLTNSSRHKTFSQWQHSFYESCAAIGWKSWELSW